MIQNTQVVVPGISTQNPDTTLKVSSDTAQALANQADVITAGEKNDLTKAPTTFVYMFNSPQFLFGLCGHSGVVFEDPATKHLRLFSFHPIKNEGEPFDKGSFSHIQNPADAADFESFRKACMTEHRQLKTGLPVRGIELSNGYKRWYERIRRVLKMEVSLASYQAMMAYCEKLAADPPRFNLFTYSCQHYVNDVLASGGIVLYGKHVNLRHGIVPNFIYLQATSKSQGILSLEKINFEEVNELPAHTEAS